MIRLGVNILLFAVFFIVAASGPIETYMLPVFWGIAIPLNFILAANASRVE